MKCENRSLKDIFIDKLIATGSFSNRRVLDSQVKDVYIDKDGLILCIDNYYGFLQELAKDTALNRYLFWVREKHNVWYVGNIDLGVEFGFYRLVLGGKSVEEFFDLLDMWGKMTQ